MTISIVKGAPGHYRIGTGVLGELETLLTDLRIQNIHIVSGRQAWEAVQPFWPERVNMRTESQFTYLEGHCTKQTVAKLADRFTADSIDAVIGIGGGTVLDTAKAAAVEAGIKAILIPTIAATCAAWTPLSVFYDEEGTFTHYEEFPIATSLVLVEPAIIAQAPVAYLKAGIGDTLAKFYEADVLIHAFYPHQEPPVWLKIAKQSAALCKDVLLKDSQAAIEAVQAQEVTEELIRVIETVIMTGGMVGGFGGKAGRIAAAHSIHNGLTEAAGAKNSLHGELVAYGILVQLALEGNMEEVKTLQAYYNSWGLPVCLEDLHIDARDVPLLAKVAQKATMPQESIHFMAGSITASTVLAAIKKVEETHQIAQ